MEALLAWFVVKYSFGFRRTSEHKSRKDERITGSAEARRRVGKGGDRTDQMQEERDSSPLTHLVRSGGVER